MLKTVTISLLLLAGSIQSIGQGYAYRNYSIKDGLVGNNVYHAVTDKEGFIWFATETGVSRFDGTSFRNFTTADGLPDNETIRLFCDSKNRIWMLPFKNKICYYYEGKIHNQENDSILRKVQLTANPGAVAETREGHILFVENAFIHGIYNINGRSVYKRQHCTQLGTEGFLSIGTNDRQEPFAFVYMGVFGGNAGPASRLAKVLLRGDAVSISLLKNFEGFADGGSRNNGFFSRYIFFPGKFTPASGNLKFRDVQTGHTINLIIDNTLNWISGISDSLVFANTSNGSIPVNPYTGKQGAAYLPAENITNTFTDDEGSLWFTSLGSGIWRLHSPPIRNILPHKRNAAWPSAIYSIGKLGPHLFCGSAKGTVYIIDSNQQLRPFAPFHRKDIKNVHLFTLFDKKLYALSEYGLNCIDEQLRVTDFLTKHNIAALSHTNKDIHLITPELFLLGTAVNSGYVRYDLRNRRLNFIQSAGGRTTAIVGDTAGYYKGTLSGLEFVDKQGNIIRYASHLPLLANRITRLLLYRGCLWVGTNDNGLVCFDGKRIIKNISASNGLVGNIIRALHADGDYLWVGTDRGINKVNIADTACPVVMQYTAADGLASDMINCIFTDEKYIYVGTPEGLSYFGKNGMPVHSRCDLHILGITVSDRQLTYQAGSTILLPHRDNNIRIDFVGISFKSQGSVEYRYKLSGIDDKWKTTRENFLQYPTLPSGRYEMQLQAINRFGVISKVITIPFEIEKALTEQTGFRLLLLFITLGLTWWLATLRTRLIRRRIQEKNALHTKISQLEHQALLAQMNPHFIFNCLNSIQQYVIDKDVAGANKFITGFSRLIRQTMDHSAKSSITVNEEVTFLQHYLALEQIRFEHSFDYTITVDNNVAANDMYLPPMLLQPYIENSIRHGIRHKKTGRGKVDINISFTDDTLICAIADNGVGRKVAQSFKSSQHIEYQSKGMLLTSQRIDLLNENGQKIRLMVEDITDSGGMVTGTSVRISLVIKN